MIIVFLPAVCFYCCFVNANSFVTNKGTRTLTKLHLPVAVNQPPEGNLTFVPETLPEMSVATYLLLLNSRTEDRLMRDLKNLQKDLRETQQELRKMKDRLMRELENYKKI
mmetsp:Transcript_7930/g.13147  ORF Transcript_7930/g.13147 Transcript_7930/m.13147 type:complete len:110 (+) Transcript_7930:56-385(+)